MSVMDWACAVIAPPSTIAPATKDVIDGFISGFLSSPPRRVEFGERNRTGLGRVAITLNYVLRRHPACPATSPTLALQVARMERQRNTGTPPPHYASLHAGYQESRVEAQKQSTWPV